MVYIPGRRVSPYTSITPFTYRDNYTYLLALEELRNYVRNELVPAVDERLGGISEQINSALDSLDAAIELAQEQADAAVQTKTEIEEIKTTIDGIKTAIDTAKSDVDTAKQSVDSSKSHIDGVKTQIDNILADIQNIADGVTHDSIVNNIIADSDSDTRGTLNAVIENIVTAKNPIRYARDYGIIGDGTDEYAVLASFLSGGGIMLFDASMEITLDVVAPLVIPEGSRLITQNSVFNVRSVGYQNEDIIRINSNTTVDSIHMVMPAMVNGRGIKVSGKHIRVGKLSAINADLSGTQSVRQRGVYILDASDIVIDNIVIKNWMYGCRVENSNNVIVHDFDISGHALAFSCSGSHYVTVNRGSAHDLHPTITGLAGHNTILVEPSNTHLTFNNIISHESAEHGFRIGGNAVNSHIKFNGCTAIAPGSRQGVGGCGFKALAPTHIDNNSRNFHSNIDFINCTVIDIKRFENSNNEAISIGKCRYVNIENFKVYALDQETAANIGVYIYGSNHVNVSNVELGNIGTYGFKISAIQATTDTFIGGQAAHINVQNAYVQGAISFAEIQSPNETTSARYITFENILSDNCTNLLSGQGGNWHIGITMKGTFIGSSMGVGHGQRTLIDILASSITYPNVLNGSTISSFYGNTARRVNDDWSVNA